MRDHARYLQVSYGSRERRTCEVLTFGRSTCRYESVAAKQAALRMRIRDLAASRVSYGYRRIHVLLRREGWQVNHKRVYRLYRLEGLRMRPKRPRRHVSARRMEARSAASRNLSQISRQYEESVATRSPTVWSCGGRSTRVLTLRPSG